MRRSDRILDDGVVGEHGQPRLLVAGHGGFPGALARQVDR
jgi:hypothetical protein